MKSLLKIILSFVSAVALEAVAFAQADQPLYENNFEKATTGPVPEDMLVLDGAFAVKGEAGNKFLELPGAPLETYGVLFGPTGRDDIAVTARIFSTARGRRTPAFGIGVNGQGGYRLQVAAAKRLVEFVQDDDVKASVPFEWQPGKWLHLKLQVRKVAADQWKVEGKVWWQGEKEPENWTITADESKEPLNGRASIWGMPFAGTPIRFDDLTVARVTAK